MAKQVNLQERFSYDSFIDKISNLHRNHEYSKVQQLSYQQQFYQNQFVQFLDQANLTNSLIKHFNKDIEQIIIDMIKLMEDNLGQNEKGFLKYTDITEFQDFNKIIYKKIKLDLFRVRQQSFVLKLFPQIINQKYPTGIIINIVFKDNFKNINQNYTQEYFNPNPIQNNPKQDIPKQDIPKQDIPKQNIPKKNIKNVDIINVDQQQFQNQIKEQLGIQNQEQNQDQQDEILIKENFNQLCQLTIEYQRINKKLIGQQFLNNQQLDQLIQAIKILQNIQ